MPVVKSSLPHRAWLWNIITVQRMESGSIGRTRAVLAEIRSALPSLQPSDARVATTVLQQPEAVIHWSVSDLAAAAGASTATVVRCAQKLGFKGFHQLKLALAQDLATFAPDEAPSTDPNERALEQVIAAGAQTVRDAAALVDRAAFRATVDALAAARRVLFCGVGTSAPLAQDAAYRFSVVGVDAQAPADVHVQHVTARLLEPGDVCVAVSHSGATREILAAVTAAAEAQAMTVAITSYSRSPLTELAGLVLVAGSREVSFRLEAVASRLAHLALLDALLVAVADAVGDRADDALRRYTDVIGEHRL
jgi:DNA-binding MurR/RpiR family transcriptional regulator